MDQNDIQRRLNRLSFERSPAYQAACEIEEARKEKERASLRELCGGIGHMFSLGGSYRCYVDGREVSRCLCFWCSEVQSVVVDEFKAV